jgi:hypothetical protein
MAAAALPELYSRPEQRGKETVDVLKELLNLHGVPGDFSSTVSVDSANCAFHVDAKSGAAAVVNIADMETAASEFGTRCPYASITAFTYDMQCRDVRVLLTHSPTLSFSSAPLKFGAKRKTGEPEDQADVDSRPAAKKSKGSTGAPILDTPLDRLAKESQTLAGADTPIDVVAEVKNIDTSEILVTGYCRVEHPVLYKFFEKFSAYASKSGGIPHCAVDLMKRSIRFWTTAATRDNNRRPAAAAAASQTESKTAEK